jgi:hypothetical protein
VVPYSFAVTNIGNITLTGITVTDPKCAAVPAYQSGDTNTDSKLDLTETWTYTCSHTVTQAEVDAGGNLSNTATADSTESSAAVNTLNIPIVQNPSIQVVKSLATYTDNDFSWTITRGDNLWYQFAVTNTGNVTLTNVNVTDDTFAIPVTCLVTTLAPADSVVCTANTFHTVTLTEANAGHVTNTATASGDFNALPYTNSDTLITVVQPLPSSVVSGQVRDDSNGNGNLGDNDAGLANVKIELDNGICTRGVNCPSTLTNTSGVFTFNGVADGSYMLVETDPANYVSTADSDPPNDNLIDVIILGGVSSTNNVFLDTANPASCSAPDPANGFVVSTNPTNGATNVPLSTTTITVTFNQPMITTGAESVLQAGKYELKNQSNGKTVVITGVTYDPVTFTATLTIDSSDPNWQAGTLFNLTIKNLKNACGTSQPNVVRSFTTEAAISGQVRNSLDSQGIYGSTVQLSGGSCGGSCGTTTTDQNGNFQFAGFAPGSYTLAQTDLPGYSSVSDSDPPNDNLIALTLTAGSNSTGHLFTDMPACTGGVSFVASTIPANGATGVSLGITTLTVTFNQPMITYGGGSVLDIGNFNDAIDNLTLGGNVPILSITYNPNTYTATLTIDTTDPEWQPGSQYRLRIKNGIKNSCNVKPTGADVDVLFTTAAYISGQVRNSLDSQGIYGSTVQLSGGSCGGTCGTTTTDVSGNFRFSGLAPGSYTLTQTDLPGYSSVSDSNPPNDNLIALILAGANSTGHLFTDMPACTAGVSFVTSTYPVNGATGVSLSTTTLTVTFNQPMITYGGGSVLDVGNFNDRIDNLTLGGNVPILGVSYNPNTFTATLTIDTSDPDWKPGSQYRLRIKNNVKNACSTSPSGSDVDILFTTNLVISGQVRYDSNNNGVLTDPDAGIPSVTVRLYNSVNTLIGTTTTNAGGYFTFGTLSPGTYYVRETDPAGFISTADSFGANDNEITVTLAAGANSIGHKFLDYSNLPAISVSNFSAFEKNNGQTNYQFVVSLSKTSASTVTVNYTTFDVSATGGANCTSGVDYINTSGVVTFAPGFTSQNVIIPVCGDTDLEPDETFTVNLSSPVNAIINTSGTGIIFDDDSPGFTSGDFVKTITPPDLSTNVSVNTSIVIEFNRPMCESTVLNPTNTRLFSGGDVSAVRSYNPATWTLTITPDAPLSPLTGYQVQVRFTSTTIDGCSLFSGTHSESFTTAP